MFISHNYAGSLDILLLRKKLAGLLHNPALIKKAKTVLSSPVVLISLI
jgi:hypothetical protein